MFKRNQIELLAPAGDEECFKAAIAAGADAVYFGLEQFSARTRAKNLTVDQARYLIPLAHKHNCRAYLTLNTLIKDSEMGDAVSLVEKAVECGIDAIIIQDIGVLKVIRTCFPDLEIHASTQMTTHNISQCKFLSSLGVSQVNLSRELSLPEIKEITDYLHSQNIIPEIFVQGAFCISYSGQCYFSGHLYNQAGNRGDCVQPCRREWCLYKKENAESIKAKDYKALFHLKDNSAFPLADKLIKENVPVSLKIEGRIKNAEYVWAVTSAWREQIDLILAEKSILQTSPKLSGAINRDYTAGYIEGNISSQMFSSGIKDISQIKAGTVKNYIADSKTLILNSDNNNLKKGDRLTIKSSTDQFICTANVTGKSEKGYTIQITNKLTKKILSGQVIYKSSSVITPEELSKRIRQVAPESNTGNGCGSTEKTFKTDITVIARENEPIKITYESEGERITVESEKPLEKAQNAGLTEETLKQKLIKLGGTCFTEGNFRTEVLDPNLFIALGELNNLRRKAVEELTVKLKENKKDNKKEKENRIPELPETSEKAVSSVDAYLIDNVKDLEQFLLKKTYEKEDFKIIYELPSAMNLVDEELFSLLNKNPDVVLYFNSILMGKDLNTALKLLDRFENLSEREILCENTGLAFELKNKGCRIILGPNCNIYNSWNVLGYKENLNLSGIIPSLELETEIIEQMNFPEDLQIWYPKKMNRLLMQSRQCLVRNGSGCSKGKVDRTCIESCKKNLHLMGTQNEEIMAVKRPGFYSALFTSEKEIIPVKSDFMKNRISVWIIDKRF
ncbi:MAG: U32 family peptidase [Treponema sp.]|nr:U32 family peptidase [Treponema sp.]